METWILPSFLKAFARLVKVMVFPVVMYGYESWTIKKLSIKKRIDTFEVCVGEDS